MNTHQLEVVRGLLQRHQEQLDSLKLSQSQTLGLILNDNVIVGGICQEPDKVCRNAAAQFFQEKMGLDPIQQDIISAHCLGESEKRGDIQFPPLMKVKCSPYFRVVVWENRQVLKGLKDPDFHWKYFVDIQRPENQRAASARYREAMQKCHRKNKNKPDNEKENPKIKGDKFFVNGRHIPDPVQVPGPKKSLTFLHRKDIILITLNLMFPLPTIWLAVPLRREVPRSLHLLMLMLPTQSLNWITYTPPTL